MSSFVSAGYFLVRPCPRPQWAHASQVILPETIVTLSPCLTDVVPNLWPSPAAPACRPDSAALARMGISEANADALEAWMSTRSDAHPTEWPIPLTSLSELREVVGFLDRDENLWLVGAALPDDRVDDFFSDHDRAGGASERCHALRRALSPDRSGEVLGFEVLGNGSTECHSVVCTGSEVQLHDALGVSFNAHGLIDSYEEAKRAAAWMSEDGHGEPVVYFPWQVTVYAR